MNYLEILIPYFNNPPEPLHVLCHRIHSWVNKELKIPMGCFVDEDKIICRTLIENKEAINLNLSKFKKVSKSDWIFLKDEVLTKHPKSISIQFNYGENRLEELPKKSPILKKIKKNKTHYSLYQLLEVKKLRQLGGSTGKSIFPALCSHMEHPEFLFQPNPRLQSTKIEYLAGNKKRKFYLRIAKVFMVNKIKITNHDDFFKLYIFGFGNKKSYGCGLIQVTS